MRVDPTTPVQAMQTFQIQSPHETHTRVVSCEDYECQAYKNGWRMKLDLTTELGQRQAFYIKHHSGRSWKAVDQSDGLVTLEFASGQPCFSEHRVSNQRPEIYRVKGGDHRGNPLRVPTRVHSKPEFWVEEFAENQDRIRSAIEKG